MYKFIKSAKVYKGTLKGFNPKKTVVEKGIFKAFRKIKNVNKTKITIILNLNGLNIQ